MTLHRTGGRAVLIAAAVLLWLSAPAAAIESTFFRIGTAASDDPRYSIGAMIAGVLSNPPGSRPCDRGGSCGVPGLIAVAQATSGSAGNLNLLRQGGLEAGLADPGESTATGEALAELRVIAAIDWSTGPGARRTLLVVRADLDESLVYEIAKALWHPSHEAMLEDGSLPVAAVRIATALEDGSLLVHAGALRYYREAGLLEGSTPAFLPVPANGPLRVSPEAATPNQANASLAPPS